jgi:hypothetical protein
MNSRQVYSNVVPYSAWYDNRQQYSGCSPNNISAYNPRGIVYPFDRPYTNSSSVIAGDFIADPITKHDNRICNVSCDDPSKINPLKYMYGTRWWNNRS